MPDWFNSVRPCSSLKPRKKLRDSVQPTLDLDTTENKHKEAAAKVTALDASDGENWKHLKSDLDSLMIDIEKDLRQALAYFG
ncbi:hypothetical protein [Desulfosarcina widdelii]|uniref:hypothetical protein n=1 Tax=Desulfosarcina widdelii TaxID=947919 RepID=UPI0012D3047C|nr:hypothetical protein [Desulfosarcina widdelii]